MTLCRLHRRTPLLPHCPRADVRVCRLARDQRRALPVQRFAGADVHTHPARHDPHHHRSARQCRPLHRRRRWVRRVVLRLLTSPASGVLAFLTFPSPLVSLLASLPLLPPPLPPRPLSLSTSVCSFTITRSHILEAGFHRFNLPRFEFNGFRLCTEEHINIGSKHRVRDAGCGHRR